MASPESPDESYSRLVAPAFAALALPAVIALVKPSNGHLVWASASLLIGAGLLLASFQLSIGKLRGDSRLQMSLRASLTNLGVVAVTIAVGLLVTPPGGPPWQVAVGLAFLGLGVVVPMILRAVKTLRM
jgi:VIT1/CCC1 family predicted Fe2+/Mn2+ transporter